MQDYDKKIAEVRPGWAGSPAKQFAWGEERKRENLLVPWPQWKGWWAACWLAGLFYCRLLVRSWLHPQYLALPLRAYSGYPQIKGVLAD